ncbi:MAG: TonB-dependent receptor [Elusimicrobia bacterium]|nr:TonB-dependent receptor [Elusimicrobiota bacterium]
MRKSLLFLLVAFIMNVLSLHVSLAEWEADKIESEEELLFMEIPMVITSTLREQKISQAPSPITLVTKEEIQKRGYRRLSEVLEDVPGFEPLADLNEVVPAVRGAFSSTTNKVLILVNGHRMNGLFLGRYNIDQFIGMDAVERIEFVRGGGSALYGAGALLGVINIITKKGAEIDGTLVKVEVGSEGYESSVTYGRKKDDMDILWNVTVVDTDGTEVDVPASENPVPSGQPARDGVVYCNRYPENWSAVGTVNTKNTSLMMRMEHTERVIPRTLYTTYDLSVEPLHPRYNEQNFLADYKYTFYLDNGAKLSLNPHITYIGYWDQSVHIAGADLFPPYGRRSGSLNEHNIAGLKVFYEKDIRDDLNLITGIDFLRAAFLRTDVNNVVTDTTTVVSPEIIIDPDSQGPKGSWLIGGYLVQAEWKVNQPMTITLGGRYDTFEDRADPQFTPRAAVVYTTMQNLIVKLMYNSSYFAPQWIHTNKSSTGQYLGAPDIDPEESRNCDLIFEYNTNKLLLSADFYQSKVSGLISNVVRDNIFTYENVGDSQYRGMELVAKYDIHKLAKLEGSWSSAFPVEGRTSSSLLQNGQIKDIPENIFRYGLTLKPVKTLDVALWGRYLTSVETTEVTALAASNTPTATREISLPCVMILDTAMTYYIKDLTLQFKATNITDKDYRIAGARNGIGLPLPMPGFVYEFSISGKF